MCAGVFSVCGVGVGALAFLGDGEDLGFLQIWDLMCKLGCAD